MLTLKRHPDARAFLARAETWLATREIEHAVVLQSARQARANDTHYERPLPQRILGRDARRTGARVTRLRLQAA